MSQLINAVEDKWQITSTFAASVELFCLCSYIVYEGKTPKCHFSIDFPKIRLYVTHSFNHWYNKTMKSYDQLVIIVRFTVSINNTWWIHKGKQQTQYLVCLIKQNNIEYVFN